MIMESFFEGFLAVKSFKQQAGLPKGQRLTTWGSSRGGPSQYLDGKRTSTLQCQTRSRVFDSTAFVNGGVLVDLERHWQEINIVITSQMGFPTLWGPLS